MVLIFMWRQHWTFPYIAKVVGVLFIVALVLFIKASYYSGYETGRGDQAYQEDNLNEAIVHYERAIKWYTPFNRSVSHSVERLWEIGNKAEKLNEATLALEAYRSLRGSLYAIESFNRPYQSWIPRAEEKIATLMASMGTSNLDQLERPTTVQNRKRFAALLQRKEPLDQGGVILTEIGFLGWIVTTIGFIWYGFGDNGGWIWRRCLLWGSSIAIFFTTWIIGMMLA